MANTTRHINIIGHQNPDTDSICSALAYAWLKNRGSLNGCLLYTSDAADD